jgi:hypothetical protein
MRGIVPTIVLRTFVKVRFFSLSDPTLDATMVMTANQTKAFFEANTQVAMPNATIIQLQAEGISTVDDLLDFDKETLQQVANNLRRPGGGAPLTFGAKSQLRLLVATGLVKYYNTLGCTLMAGNLQWISVMRNFKEQWQALKQKKAAPEPEVPKVTKALPIIKWT